MLYCYIYNIFIPPSAHVSLTLSQINDLFFSSCYYRHIHLYIHISTHTHPHPSIYTLPQLYIHTPRFSFPAHSSRSCPDHTVHHTELGGRLRSLGSKATKGGCGISRRTSARADPGQGRLRGVLGPTAAKRGNEEYSPTKRRLQRVEPRRKDCREHDPAWEGCREHTQAGKAAGNSLGGESRRGLGADLSQGRWWGAQLGRAG